MIIEKVLNSSVVLVKEDNGNESILLGKGIGYGRKAGEEIVKQPSDRVFIPLSNPDAKRMLELFSSIPGEYLEITQEIVKEAEKTLNCTLSNHIYMMLTDHLHFAVERNDQGIVVTNRVFWEIKNFYKKEFAVGQFGRKLVLEKLGIDLPEEEAANIAFHIVNASKDEMTHYDAMRAAKLIASIVSIVTYSVQVQLNVESMHYSRFVTHLQFFADRYYTQQMLNNDDGFMYKQMETAYPDALKCAEKIRTHLIHTDNVFLPDEEVAYLALHVARLTLQEDS